MSITAIVISICLLGVITFVYRFSFISNQGKKIAEKIPQDFLRLLAPSTFAAIITNNLLSHQSSPEDLKLKGIVAVLALPSQRDRSGARGARAAARSPARTGSGRACAGRPRGGRL